MPANKITVQIKASVANLCGAGDGSSSACAKLLGLAPASGSHIATIMHDFYKYV